LSERDLPVDPARLRRQFPALDDGDIAAFEEATRRILSEPRAAERARITRELLARGKAARERMTAGTTLSAEEFLAARYLTAVEKMQGRTS